VLPVQFSAAQLNANWIANKYRAQAQAFEDHKDLLQHQFMAVGTMRFAEQNLTLNTLAPNQDHQLSVELDFWQLQSPPGA
jgi:hypothetical protein